MRDKAYISNIQVSNSGTTEISVVPLITDSCINCSHGTCAKRGKPFLVSNKKNFNLHRGDIVKINAPLITQTLQGLWSLFFPLISATVGYFLTDFIIKQHSLELNISLESIEGIKAVGVLGGIAIAVIIVLVVNKFIFHLVKPEITTVLSSATDAPSQ